MTTTAPAPARSRIRTAARATRALGRDTVHFLLAISAIALHVIDDNFVSPEPGTSAGDHLVSGLVPLAFLGLAAWVYPRLRGGLRGALALAFGPLGIAAGVEAFHYTRAVGPSGDDFTGLLCIPAGLLLLGLGATTLWRTRRTDGSMPRRGGRRALLGVASIPVAMVVTAIGVSYGDTHLGRAVVPPNELHVPYENVSFQTGDGLELKGWYIPSKNGAAVISFPGRKGPQERARMLARHGYGVLLFDRRGEGQSEGEPHTFGWGGDRDIKAAIAFLQRRPDVDPDRIGGIGLSVGGELMLETAAETEDLAAVVSEGAGARTMAERSDQDQDAVNRAFNLLPNAVQHVALSVFSNQSAPAHLKDLVGRIAPRPMLLIAAPNSPNGEDLNRVYYDAAHEPKALWEIPESRHMGGLDARPEEYERRVIGFFDHALLP